MRIDLPERLPGFKYEFIGGCLWRREQWPSGAQRGESKLIARLDRGEVLEIGCDPRDALVDSLADVGESKFTFDEGTGLRPCEVCGDTRFPEMCAAGAHRLMESNK